MTDLIQELLWLDRNGPVARHYGDALRSNTSLRNRRIAFWNTIVPNAVPLIEPVLMAGAEVFVGPCHTTSTDERVVTYLGTKGVEAYGSSAMTDAEYDAALSALVAFKPDIIVSSGGDPIIACARAGHTPQYCLEGTGTGISRLAEADLPCAVWDWNTLPLKDGIEHRFHVADGIWPAFFALTGLSLAMRTVVVIGYGSVGEGIAARARSLDARTIVVEQDRLKRARAGFAGHTISGLETALSKAEIVVTATGRDGILVAEHWSVCRDGVILFNAGHSPLEIDVASLTGAGLSEVLRPGITLHRPAGKDILLLAQGGVLNLSTPFGPFANDVWDIFNGLILAGLGNLTNDTPGIHPYPAQLADAVLKTFLEERSK